LIEEYFSRVELDINSCPFVTGYNLFKDKRSLYIGFIEGAVRFMDNSILHFMEFVDVSRGVKKYKYSYHYENPENILVFRYDMAPHFRDIETFPHHKHERAEISSSKEPFLKDVLSEIENLIAYPGN
jgi:hypothetical protein